jgi:hypothetical protein
MKKKKDLSCLMWAIPFFGLILLIFLAKMGGTRPPAHPKFQAGQEVTYEVPDFYKKVCSNEGLVKDFLFNEYNYNGKKVYRIETSWELYCPREFLVDEADLQAVK